jgi:uncharacterized membrane protein
LDYSTFGRQRASQVTVLISLALQIVVVSVGATVFWIARHYGNFWIATLMLLLLSAISLSGYVIVLGRMDRFVQDRRETLVAELCKA